MNENKFNFLAGFGWGALTTLIVFLMIGLWLT
jgi:hypothetical protein